MLYFSIREHINMSYDVQVMTLFWEIYRNLLQSHWLHLYCVCHVYMWKCVHVWFTWLPFICKFRLFIGIRSSANVDLISFLRCLPLTVFCTIVSINSIDQSHRYGRHLAACREPAGSYDKTTRTALCFEHKTQYLLIRAPYTRIVVFWHISNIHPMISQSQISCNNPTFYITAIFVKYCYTTGSWLL